jgi:type II secretory pathway pseudopilin PulG
VEILTVIAIITVLAAMMLPALNMAREASRQSTCQNNLRQIGMAMLRHADRGDKRFCSGAFDWEYDGCVTETGWVADLVSEGTPVGKLLCPSNPAQISQTYNQLLSVDTASFTNCVNGLGSLPTTSPSGDPVVNPCREIHSAGLAPNSEPRRAHVEAKIFDRDFNTNYTASWFLVRGEVVVNGTSGNLMAKVAGCGTGLRSRNSTRGPLRTSDVDNAAVSASAVPLLGDASANGMLGLKIGKNVAGSPVTLSFTKGPVMKTDLSEPVPNATQRSGSDGWWKVWAQGTLQDYRGFAPVHRSSCCILFADNSVRSFDDANYDGYLNNGFPMTTDGFKDATVEVADKDLESCYSIVDRAAQQQ